MEIQINNLPVDFELENESTVNELVESIYEWIKERELILLQVGIDNEFYIPENIKDDSLENIEVINFIVQSKSDMVINTIEEGTAYCNRAVKYLDESSEKGEFSQEQITNLAEGVTWLLSVVSSVCQLLGLDAAKVKFRDKLLSQYTMGLLKFQSEIGQGKITSDTYKDVFIQHREDFLILREVFKMLLMSDEMKVLTLNSVDSPDVIITSLKQIKDALPDSIKNIEEIAVAYQSGNDEEGAQKMESFIQFTYSYIRSCYQAAPVFNVDFSEIVIDGQSLDEKNEEIKDLLSETLQALENDDIISLADILEYEFMPVMESLGEYMESLTSQIVEK